MTFSSKERFMQNKERASKHRERMADPDFLAAAEAALQHFADVETLHSKNAKASYHRIAGSRDFLGVLLNLSDPPVLPQRPKPPSLDYTTQ